MRSAPDRAHPENWITGRLILDDEVRRGRILIQSGLIVRIETDDEQAVTGTVPYVAPGYVDVHVHGWGGHDALGGAAALDGMARALLRRGVTSFLPSAYTAPFTTLRSFAAIARDWMADAPTDGAQPLGFNLEGPFLSRTKRGMHDPAFLLDPADVSADALEPLMDGLRLITVAPEAPGALELIAFLRDRGVAVSLGHSQADLATSRAGYAAGARSTTHLFNAMSGFDHRRPGLAVAALIDDEAYVELIADGQHVHPGLWSLIDRMKPPDRLILVSDALAPAGTGVERAHMGAQEIEVRGPRATLAGTATLAGSVMALDSAVRNLVHEGFPLPRAIAAASRHPATMLGITDRGRISLGQRAHLVELDDGLRVTRVFRDDRWVRGVEGAADHRASIS